LAVFETQLLSEDIWHRLKKGAEQQVNTPLKSMAPFTFLSAQHVSIVLPVGSSP